MRLPEYAENGEWSHRPDIADMSAPVVLTMRDQTCSARSNRRRGFFFVDHTRANRAKASKEMWEDISRWQGHLVPVSYEGLVEEGMPYMSVILQQLGLDPQEFDWPKWLGKFGPEDGNLKYIQ